MPCYDPDPYPYNRTPLDVEREMERLRKRKDELTQMLCSTCQKIEKLGSLFFTWIIPEDVVAWWEEHKKFDEERKAKGG